MNKLSMFNSCLLAVCLGVSGWVAQKSAANGEQLAAVKAGVEATKEATEKSDRSNFETLQRLERKLEEMLPRREFDSRILLIESEQRKLDIRLRELDLEILKLKS